MWHVVFSQFESGKQGTLDVECGCSSPKNRPEYFSSQDGGFSTRTYTCRSCRSVLMVTSERSPLLFGGTER